MNGPLFWAIGVLALGAVVLSATALAMRTVSSTPEVWHVDLRKMARTGKPNDFLAGTKDYAAAEVDRTLLPLDEPGSVWLEKVREVALSQPRTELLAGSPEEGQMTFVQRSAVFAFPDYITVQAEGEDRAIWSRSRYGRSDLGVNERRVGDWLGTLER